MWSELHQHALNHTTGNDDSIWLKQWSTKIPRYTKGCKCNEHWGKWLAFNKPDFSSAEKYFDWSVKAHNAVNIRLGKQELSSLEVKVLYK